MTTDPKKGSEASALPSVDLTVDEVGLLADAALSWAGFLHAGQMHQSADRVVLLVDRLRAARRSAPTGQLQEAGARRCLCGQSGYVADGVEEHIDALGICHSVDTCWRWPFPKPVTEAAAAPPSAPQEGLERAFYLLRALVDRLDFVHSRDDYRGVWAVSQLHVGPYRGPTYTKELDEARALVVELERALPLPEMPAAPPPSVESPREALTCTWQAPYCCGRPAIAKLIWIGPEGIGHSDAPAFCAKHDAIYRGQPINDWWRREHISGPASGQPPARPPSPAVDAAPAAPVVTALTEKQLNEEK